MQHGVFAPLFGPTTTLERVFLLFKPSTIVGGIQEVKNETSAPTCVIGMAILDVQDTGCVSQILSHGHRGTNFL